MLLYQRPRLGSGLAVATKLHEKSRPEPPGVTLHGIEILSCASLGARETRNRPIDVDQGFLRESFAIQQLSAPVARQTIIGLALEDSVDLIDECGAVAGRIELRQKPDPRCLEIGGDLQSAPIRRMNWKPSSVWWIASLRVCAGA